MRMCPISREEFQPQSADHYFANKEAFLAFIENSDPVKEFTVSKREVNWTPSERTCLKCGKEFVAAHPRMQHCEDCR